VKRGVEGEGGISPNHFEMKKGYLTSQTQIFFLLLYAKDKI
jgi:hypothetical protein